MQLLTNLQPLVNKETLNSQPRLNIIVIRDTEDTPWYPVFLVHQEGVPIGDLAETADIIQSPAFVTSTEVKSVNSVRPNTRQSPQHHTQLHTQQQQQAEHKYACIT